MMLPINSSGEVLREQRLFDQPHPQMLFHPTELETYCEELVLLVDTFPRAHFKMAVVFSVR